jgi:hypothetical protein
VGLFEAIEATGLAVYLRQSVWAYPLVNTLHLLGIALLIGGVSALDLRLLGVWRSVPAAGLAPVFGTMAMAGFGLAVCAGVLLFIVRATDYAGLWLFQLKMALLGIALVNALLFLRMPYWRGLKAGRTADGAAPAGVKLMAALSLLLWLCVLLAGRLVGYA